MRELVEKNRCILKSAIYLHYVNLYFESEKNKEYRFKIMLQRHFKLTLLKRNTKWRVRSIEY